MTDTLAFDPTASQSAGGFDESMSSSQYGSELSADSAARFQDALDIAGAPPLTLAALQSPSGSSSTSDSAARIGTTAVQQQPSTATAQPPATNDQQSSAPSNGVGAAGVTAHAAATNTQAQAHEQRVQQAITHFESQGWTHAQAVGIVANLDAESGLDPNAHQHGGGPGYGLGQWEHPRQHDFQAWAGHDIQSSTFDEQLQFVQHELTGTQSAAGNALRRTTTVEGAASTVTRRYERPADTEGEAVRRADRARQIDSQIGH